MANNYRDNNLWNATASAPVETAVLDENLSVDLVIVGGGFTGLSAALHAARKGASVCLLEAEEIGFGGSGRNVGLVNAGLWLPPEDVVSALGSVEGARLNRVLAEGPDTVFQLIAQHQIQCEAVQNGTLHCAHAPNGMRDLERRYRQLRDIGAPVQLLDAREARHRVGSPAVHGALFDPRAGTVQPKAYAQGLAHAAIAAGARIVQGARAEDIHHDGGNWNIRVNSCKITANAVIEATNAYGQNAGRFTPLHFFQLATEPLPDEMLQTILPGAEGCWDTALVMSSFRRDGNGRVLVGAIGRLDHFASGVHLAWARRKLAALFPQLRNAKFEHFWHGRIANTFDHLPKIERLGPAGYSVFGYSGRGISTGTLFGRALARTILTGDEKNLPITPLDCYTERFTHLREAYFEAGATMMHAASNRLS